MRKVALLPESGNHQISAAVDLHRLTDALLRERAGIVETRLVTGYARRYGCVKTRLTYLELLEQTGASQSSLVSAIASAVEHGFLVVDRSARPHAYEIAPTYCA